MVFTNPMQQWYILTFQQSFFFFKYLVFYFGTDHELQKNGSFSLQEYMIRNSVISYKENTYFEKYEQVSFNGSVENKRYLYNT